MSNYSVYVLTSPEGKRYIGMTMRKPETRWNSGRGYKNNDEMYRDIEHHGWENFEKEIVAKGLTREDAEMLERKLIKRYDARKPEHGYNIECGGIHPKHHDERTKQKMSVSSSGKFRDEEYRRHISESKRGAMNGMFGRFDKLNPQSREVTATRGSEVLRFESISGGSRFLGLSKNAFKNISACCAGKRRTAYGYVWRYADDQKD